MESHDILLKNGLIFADPGKSEVVAHHFTLISGNSFSGVNLTAFPDNFHGTIIDCTGCLIMPGLVNAHTHAAMSLLRGIADDKELDRWLNDYIFPAEGQFADPDFVYTGSLLSAAEMVLNGITTFADGYFFMEESARAAMDVGIRGVIAQGILDVPTPDIPEPGSWPRRIEEFLTRFPGNELVQPALFCHSPYLCGPDTFIRAAETAKQNGILLFSHVAETAWEASHIREKYSCSPVEFLHNLNIMGENFIAVHLVHLSDNDKRLLAESASKAVHCPECNMKLASGASPVNELIQAGVNVAIGTDGPASNNNLDLFEEIRSASFLAKVIGRDPRLLDAAAMLKMATINGAKALGLQDKIGIIEPEKAADLIVLNFNAPHLTPVYDPISHLAYSAKGSDVRDVIINGKVVVKDRRLVTINEEEIRMRTNLSAGKIAKKFNLTNYGAILNRV